MNTAKKLEHNQAIVDRFKDILGDVTYIAEIMPKSSYDILAQIGYWKDKKLEPDADVTTKALCNQQIKDLELIMIAGNSLAIEMLGKTEESKTEQRYPKEEDKELDRSKLLTFEEVRNGIGVIHQKDGKEAATKYANEMLLDVTKHKEGIKFLPAAITGIVKGVIDKLNEAPDKAKKTKSEKDKPETKAPTGPVEKALADLRRRYPSLGENISDEDCSLIDLYETLIAEFETNQKKESLRAEGAKNEHRRIIEEAQKKYDGLSETKRANIKANAVKKYKALPSEDTSLISEKDFIISHYASTLPGGEEVFDEEVRTEREPALAFCTPGGTVEQERKLMKEAQEFATKLIKADKEEDAVMMAKLFGGNFFGKSPIEHGRGWKDPEVLCWINWIKEGCPEKEWHLYQQKIKDQDDKEFVKDAKKTHAETITDEKYVPEQLKALLVEVIDEKIKNKRPVTDIVNACKALYEQHNRPFHYGEVKSLITHQKGVIEKIKDNFVGPPEEKDTTIFVRMETSETSDIWKRNKDVATLDDLQSAIDEIPDWKDGLNLTLDLIITKNQIEEAKDWGDAKVEKWFKAYTKAGAKTEPAKKEDPLGLSSTLIADKDLKTLDHKKRRTLVRAIGELFKKYGVENDVLMQIINKIRTIKEGYAFSQWSKKPNPEIYKFLKGIARIVVPTKPIVIPQ